MSVTEATCEWRPAYAEVDWQGMSYFYGNHYQACCMSHTMTALLGWHEAEAGCLNIDLCGHSAMPDASSLLMHHEICE